jgi:hypothetical protein
MTRFMGKPIIIYDDTADATQGDANVIISFYYSIIRIY